MTLKIGTVSLTILLVSVLAPSPAGASFHLMNIKEVFVGPGESQFVELQMRSSGQSGVSGQSITVFDPAGAQTGSFTFTDHVSNAADQATILIATPAAEAQFGVQAELEMTAVMAAAGGKVCFSSVDCVSWGSFSASPDTGGSPSGAPFNSPNPLPQDMSMERAIEGGSSPDRLDGQDDTNDSSADFRLADPSPTPNSNVATDPPPPETRMVSPGDSETYVPQSVRMFWGFAEPENEEGLSVEVALRKKLKDGSCKWWGGKRFVERACKEKLFVEAEGSDTWTYDLTKKLRSSVGTKTRFYTAFSKGSCTCTPFEESEFEKGRNRNRFEIL